MFNADMILRDEDKARDKLIDFLSEWFDIGDSYIFDLTRVKESRFVGTMSIEDFEEWGEDRVSELADDLISWLKSDVK